MPFLILSNSVGVLHPYFRVGMGSVGVSEGTNQERAVSIDLILT